MKVRAGSSSCRKRGEGGYTIKTKDVSFYSATLKVFFSSCCFNGTCSISDPPENYYNIMERCRIRRKSPNEYGIIIMHDDRRQGSSSLSLTSLSIDFWSSDQIIIYADAVSRRILQTITALYQLNDLLSVIYCDE